jgi:hypothetical protein
MKSKARYGYICETEYDWEVGEALGGSKVYASVKDLKRERDCVNKGCGIVKVKVQAVELIQRENKCLMIKNSSKNTA